MNKFNRLSEIFRGIATLLILLPMVLISLHYFNLVSFVSKEEASSLSKIMIISGVIFTILALIFSVIAKRKSVTTYFFREGTESKHTSNIIMSRLDEEKIKYMIVVEDHFTKDMGHLNVDKKDVKRAYEIVGKYSKTED